MRRLPLLPALASFALVLACSRGGNIESVPGPVYIVTVENPMSHTMDVWYDDGEVTSELGRLVAGDTREFVIAGPADAAVEIIARDEGRTHTITRAVTLTRGGSPRVVLTP